MTGPITWICVFVALNSQGLPLLNRAIMEWPEHPSLEPRSDFDDDNHRQVVSVDNACSHVSGCCSLIVCGHCDGVGRDLMIEERVATVFLSAVQCTPL